MTAIPTAYQLRLPFAVAHTATVRHPAQREDMEGACCLAFARALASFDPAKCRTGTAGLGGWLYTAVHLGAIQHLRAIRRAQKWRQMTGADLLPARDGPDAGDRLDAVAIADRLQAALAPADWEALWGVLALGLTLAEVGRRQGVSKEAARLRLGRALARARVALGVEGEP